jgi:hypothetical protein
MGKFLPETGSFVLRVRGDPSYAKETAARCVGFLTLSPGCPAGGTRASYVTYVPRENSAPSALRRVTRPGSTFPEAFVQRLSCSGTES